MDLCVIPNDVSLEKLYTAHSTTMWIDNQKNGTWGVHSSQHTTIQMLSHQSTHEMSPPHHESPKWNQRQHHQNTLHKQWRSMSSQIHQHHKSSKARSKNHWLGGKWVPANIHKLALIASRRCNGNAPQPHWLWHHS
jgi:hypothetical protein